MVMTIKLYKKSFKQLSKELPTVITIAFMMVLQAVPVQLMVQLFTAVTHLRVLAHQVHKYTKVQLYMVIKVVMEVMLLLTYQAISVTLSNIKV